MGNKPIAVDFGQIRPSAFQTRTGFVLAFQYAQSAKLSLANGVTKSDIRKIRTILDFEGQKVDVPGTQVAKDDIQLGNGSRWKLSDIDEIVKAYQVVQQLNAILDIEKRLIGRMGRQDALSRYPLKTSTPDRRSHFLKAAMFHYPALLTMQAEAKFLAPHHAYIPPKARQSLLWPFVALVNAEAAKALSECQNIREQNGRYFIAHADNILPVVKESFPKMNARMRENVMPIVEHTLSQARQGVLGVRRAPRFGKH